MSGGWDLSQSRLGTRSPTVIIQETKETLLKPIQGEGRPKIQCAQMARAQRVKEKRFEDGLTKLPGDCNTVNQEKREKIR